MAKKRTKKQKQSVHHNFNLTWNPASSHAHVKGQINIGSEGNTIKAKDRKNADLLAQDGNLSLIKHNIIRSIIIISFILCLELVIYSLGR